jgi:hypothetical protein
MVCLLIFFLLTFKAFAVLLMHWKGSNAQKSVGNKVMACMVKERGFGLG